MTLLHPFPDPPRWVRHTFDRLKVPPDLMTQQELRELDRPWDPAGCSEVVRAELWPWLDDVADWINHEYAWQTARSIPACWPQHPHLGHEIAVLACLRVSAAEAAGPQVLEEWHRYALPGFLERMADRLGQLGCPPGKHTDWPGRSRHTEYASPRARDLRNQQYEDDASGHPRSDPPPAIPPPPAPRWPGGGRRLTAVPDPDHGEGVSS